MQPRIKLAAIAKNEGAYIPQWVFHHLRAGFDQIEIWINGTTDNSIAIIEEISAHHPGKLIVRDADGLLEECKRRSVNFQIETYAKAFNETKASGDFTHIFFLDLDEYWISLDPTISIKDFIINQKEFDTVSFQWLIDIPHYDREMFTPILGVENILQKDRHVKTLIAFSDKKTKILIHNSIVDDGISLLGNGDELIETHPEQEHKQKVSNEYFNDTKLVIDPFFILHLVYKSQAEYVASLMRGRVHVNDTNIFKLNRFGYAPYQNDDQLLITFSQEHIQNYNKEYEDFLSTNNLHSLLKEAQRFVYAKCNRVLDLLDQDPSLLALHDQQLRGVEFQKLKSTRVTSESPHYHIDVIKLFSDTLDIRGWVHDPLSSDSTHLEIITHPSNVVSLEMVARPDVLQVHPDAHLECGFKISIKLDASEVEKLNDTELPFKIFAENSYFRCELKTGKTITVVHPE
ncbi:glycosyltransferase family 2 protein [Pseudomonas syringae]|uniref:glycosyltransferase family 2 protein n=1 Tax=Pseudomonas syringae TaxID=317 RepID=UPI003F84DB6B